MKEIRMNMDQCKVLSYLKNRREIRVLHRGKEGVIIHRARIDQCGRSVARPEIYESLALVQRDPGEGAPLSIASEESSLL